MMSHEDLVKEVYAALNKNDTAGAMKLFDDDVLRIEPPGLPSSDTYRGLKDFESVWTQSRNTWAEGLCKPERLIASGNIVLAYAVVHVRLKNKTEWIDGKVYDVFTFRNSKIVDFRSFLDSVEAYKFAGITRA